MSQRMGSRISSDRIARADARPTSGRPVTGYLSDEAILTLPKPKTRTEEEKRKAATEAALEALGAAQEVAMLTGRRHSCTHLKPSDPPCREQAHSADVAAGKAVAEALGLRPPEPQGTG